MIIDLDAHQCNGQERDFMDDRDVFIIDVYNPDIYPYDFSARKAIGMDIPVFSTDNDEKYLNKLRNNIPQAMDHFSPNIIFYNAGTDIMVGDKLGSKKVH